MSSMMFVAMVMALMVAGVVDMTSSYVAAASIEDDQETVRAMIAELDKIRHHLQNKNDEGDRLDQYEQELKTMSTNDKFAESVDNNREISDYSQPHEQREISDYSQPHEIREISDYSQPQEHKVETELRLQKKRRRPSEDEREQREISDYSQDENKDVYTARKKNTRSSKFHNDDDSGDSATDDRIERLRLAARDVVISKLRAIIDKAAAEAGNRHQ